MTDTKTLTQERFLEIIKETQNFTKLNYGQTLLQGFRLADPVMIKEGATDEYIAGWRAAMELVRYTIQTRMDATPVPDGAEAILKS